MLKKKGTSHGKICNGDLILHYLNREVIAFQVKKSGAGTKWLAHGHTGSWR